MSKEAVAQQKKDGSRKPRFWPALKLRCPYCEQTPLRQQGSWFSFRRGCKSCDYRYEREIGYYTGASWMVTFTLVSMLAFGLAALMLWLFPNLNSLLVVAIASLAMVLTGLLITPFCMALWLYLEHWFHPLNEEDSIDKEWLN